MTTLQKALAQAVGLVAEFRQTAKAHEIRSDRPELSLEQTEWHAGYDEGVSGCADKLQRWIDTHGPEIEAAVRDAERYRKWRDLDEHPAADVAWLNPGEDRDEALDAMQADGGG